MRQVAPDRSDIRSYDVIFVPFCLLCRGLVSRGLVKQYTSVVEPVIQELIRRNMNIVQMPCPELHFGGYEQGLERIPKLKIEYDIPEYREICRELASKTMDLMEAMHKEGYKVRGILGIEYSPSCAVNLIYMSHSSEGYSSKGYTSHGKGVFMEEIEAELSKRKLEIPMLGVHLRGMKKTIERLREVFDSQDSTQVKLFAINSE